MSSTTDHASDSSGRFHIVHPFHPLRGKEYEMVARTVARAKDRVYYYGPDGRLKSFLVNLTDLYPVDAFTRISAGRSAFRVDDLLELWERLDRRKRGEGRGKGV